MDPQSNQDLVIKLSYQEIIDQRVFDRRKNAQKLFQEGEVEQAISEYTKVIFLKPKLAEVYIELGDIYKSIKDYTMAITLYKKSNSLQQSIVTESTLRELILTKGMMLLEQGENLDFLQGTEFEQFSFALRFTLDDIMNSQTQKSTGNEHFLKAICYMQLNYKQYALEELNQALKIDDKFVEALLLKGKILWSLNNVPEGNQIFWKVEDIQPDHPEIQEFLKLIIPKADTLLKETRYLLVQNELDNCMLNVKKGLELFPNNTQFLLIKGFIFRKRGEYEQSLSTLLLATQTLRDQQMQVEVNNQIALTLNEMGIISYGRQQYDEAIQYFQESVKYKIDDWSTYANIGDCYRLQNNIQQALQNYEMAQKYGGNNIQEINNRLALVKHSIGIHFFNQRQWNQALENFTQSINLNNRQAMFYQNRGKCLLQLQRHDEAIDDYIKCNQLDPNNHEVATLINKLKQTNANRKQPYYIQINKDL